MLNRDNTNLLISVIEPWHRKLPEGKSKCEHYKTFSEYLDKLLLAYDFDKPQIILSASLVPILRFFCEDFKSQPLDVLYGEYCAGTYKGHNVIVSPYVRDDEIYITEGTLVQGRIDI